MISKTATLRNNKIGKHPTIWHYANIYEATLGSNVKVGSYSEIGKCVIIGNNVLIGAHCFICEGVTIEDNVFIGPNVVFTNDKYPPSSKEKWGKIKVKKGASVGAGCIILPGVIIGERAMVGAGSVVTKNVPANTTVIGNPAK